MTEALREALRNNRTIHGIKEIRRIKNCKLMVAKEIWEALKAIEATQTAIMNILLNIPVERRDPAA